MAKKTIQRKKNQDNKVASFIEFIKKERSRFLFGVILTFVGAYILLGEISFFVTGAADQSKVANKTFFELVSQKQQISNWTGVAGGIYCRATC